MFGFRFKMILVFFFASLIFSCRFSASNNENKKQTNVNGENTNLNGQSRASQYFWGTWIAMDSGKTYVIDEDKIVLKNSNHEISSYEILSSSDTTLQVSSIGMFEKQSDSIMLNNSISYFRKGGTNLKYKMKLVGFENSVNFSRSASVSNMQNLNVRGQSKTYQSYLSEGIVDANGDVTLTSARSGDVQTITVSQEGISIVVIPGVTVETNGSNMGTIPISYNGEYSLKITGKIDENEKSDGYLYANNFKIYPMTLTITNISDVTSNPSVCTITSADAKLKILSTENIQSGVAISTLKPGVTKTISLSVSYSSLVEGYVDTGLIVNVKNALTGKDWNDYVSLRFFAGLVPITVLAQSTENNSNAALNGFAIYPDGNSQFFSVPHNADKTIYVPTFGKSEKFLLAFSGATVEGELSNSTEMQYTVFPGSAEKFNIGNDTQSFINAVQFGEGGRKNETEDTAFETQKEFQAYLSDGDIDYFRFSIPTSSLVKPDFTPFYTLTYTSEYGAAPIAKKFESGTKLTASDLLNLTRPYYDFAGWYSTSDFSGSEVKEISSASHGDVVLWAKWDLGEKKLIEITAKDIPALSLERGDNLLSLSGDITDEDLIAVGTFIKNLPYGYYVWLDLSNVKGITKIPEKCFYSCHDRLRAVAIPEGIVSIGEEAFSLCYLREGVYFSKSLISIEKSAFSFLDCESIIIPKNVRRLYGHKLWGTD